MASGTINAYNLGEVGVDVDKTQVHKDDGALTKAQNCTTDPTGVGGGVRKRPGLLEFNAIAGAGSELGGIGVPLGLLANRVGGTALGAGPTRSIYWARSVTGTNLGASAGWWKSTDLFATAATAILSAIPANPRSAQISTLGTGVVSAYNGSPGSGVVVRNKFYYAANDYTEGSTAPVIRVFDGTTDSEFVRIPVDISGTPSFQCGGILSMLAVGDIIYLTVMDQTDTSTITGGRVFSLNPSSGALIQLGLKFAPGDASVVPYALTWHMGRLWLGTYNRQTFAGAAGLVYWIRPGIDTVWTLDRTMATGRGVAFLISYQGQLFVGADAGSSSNASTVEVRSSLGAWSVSLSVAAGGLYRMFLNAVVFLSNLYCANHEPVSNETTIRKFDGTTWTVVHTTTTGAEEVALPMCWVENSLLFFGGGGADSGDAALLSSPDGAVWTSRTANLSAHTGLNCVGVIVT